MSSRLSADMRSAQRMMRALSGSSRPAAEATRTRAKAVWIAWSSSRGGNSTTRRRRRSRAMLRERRRDWMWWRQYFLAFTAAPEQMAPFARMCRQVGIMRLCCESINVSWIQARRKSIMVSRKKVPRQGTKVTNNPISGTIQVTKVIGGTRPQASHRPLANDHEKKVESQANKGGLPRAPEMAHYRDISAVSTANVGWVDSWPNQRLRLIPATETL